MKRSTAPALAWVDGCIERARAVTKRRLSSRWFRRLVKGKEKFNPPRRMSRRDAFEHMRDLQAERLHRRRREAFTPLEVANWDEYEQRRRSIDAGYLWAEGRSALEVMHAIVRDQMAAAFDRLAASPVASQDPSYYRKRAERLRKARRHGHWGNHRETGQWKMFFDDRSGLVRFDPSEARREQARQIRRLKPRLVELASRGYRIYSIVFTEPNAAPGTLAAAKRAMQRRFCQAILGRNTNGSRRRDRGAFPEIVGAYTVQEDPLSARDDWNQHVNVIAVIDSKLCTPLDPELDLEMPPVAGKRRGVTPPGLLCYRKLHYVWGRQLKGRPIEARNEIALDKALLEAIKYPEKWVSSKGLRAARDADQSSGGIDLQGMALSPVSAGDREGAERAGPAPGCDRRGPRPGPPIVEWPLERLNEWIEAGRGFRRARGYGCLYRLTKDLPEDDERDFRMIGEIVVTPRGAIVTVTYCETPRSAPVNLIHGDKSGADFRGSSARAFDAQARAGPASAQAVT